MSQPSTVRRWPRRLLWGLGGGAGLLLLAVVLLWWSLPTLVRVGFDRGTQAVGFTRSSIQVDRADLSGLRAQELSLHLGGLDVQLDAGAVDYSLRELMSGGVERVIIEGLAVTLDFTQPRRGVLPDAIEDLLAQMGGDGPLVWPVGELTLSNARLVLVLPGGPQSFAISGSARRQPDGRVAFTVRATHPDQELDLTGTVRTETMDGEVRLERLSLQPGFLLEIARELGLFALPADTTLTSERVELSGTVNLAAGVPSSYTGDLRVSGVRAEVAGTMIAMDDLVAQIAQAAGGVLSGDVQATLQAANAAAGWNAGASRLHLALADGRVQGGVEEVAFAFGDAAKGRLALTVDAGVPPLGGTPQAKAQLMVSELVAGGLAFAPLEISAAGWTDRATLTVPQVALSGAAPALLTEFTATGTHLLATNRALEGSVKILAHESLRAFLPAGWALVAPALPTTVAQIDFRGTTSDGGSAATVVLRSTVPRMRLASGDLSMEGAPTLEATITADARGAAMAVAFAVEEIATQLPVALPTVNALNGGIEIAPMSFAAWTALFARRVPAEDLQLVAHAALAKSSAHGSTTLTVRREAATSAWQVVASVSAGGISGKFGPTHVTDLTGNVHLDSGPLPDDRIGTWMQLTAPKALAEAVLSQCDVRVSVTAAAIENPGVARAEWAGAWLIKPAMVAEGARLAGSLTVNAGIVRAGPEVIEQPTLKVAFSGDYAMQEVTADVSALVEGAPLKFTAAQRIGFDDVAQAARGEGTFTLEPFTLTNSDIVTRWVPSLSGVAVSGTVGASGALHYASDGTWDGSTALTLSHGMVNYPAQKVSAEGLSVDLAIDSLAQLRTPPGQRVNLARLAVGDIVVSDIAVRFRTASSSVIHIEGVQTRVFDGSLNAEPFSLYFPDPDVVLDLTMSDLDADQLVRTFELFTGTLTGRLRGRLPIGLLAGRPIIGEGFLELEEDEPALLSFNTGGLFTVGLPDRTVIDQLNRLPYELLEDGLRSLDLRHFRIDLFRRDRPDVPIEMLLGGTAHTRRADVPIELTVRVNGSIAEVVQHLLELIMM